ncbi:cilia- and flagella-associated protein 91 [Cololabis saira]|uniref:cilia- and flagella-associated protein 91 n=1 Tax=Cololabis saira TaxID=129043 RepID=UPI002AD3D03C|nr:cilia- and flagella-associated protein 91 [Cololabis saira]
MSSSVTGTVRKQERKSVGQKVHTSGRDYDCVYDPVYTVSSEVEHTRARLQAYAKNLRVRRLPEFGSMFTDRPRYTLKVYPVEPLAVLVSNPWRRHAEQRRETQLAGLIPIDRKLRTQPCRVTGGDYWKYLTRPLVPSGQTLHPGVSVTVPEDFSSNGGNGDEQQPSHRTVGVQTDYRESETQTDPHSPEYVARPGSTPSELLQLAVLTWGRGLPAGLAEVEMIERARAKRAWEATLPPPDDLNQLDKRRRMMEEMEAKEWAFREGEIQKLQEARLAVVKDLLRQRNEAQKDFAKDRLQQIDSEHQKQREIKLGKIQHDYMRALRKLEAKRKNVEGKLERPDIVTDLLKQQIPRDVVAIRKATELESEYLDTYGGLLTLEAGLKPWMDRQPKVIDHAVTSPASKAFDLLKKYKVQREEVNKPKTEKPFELIEPAPSPGTPVVEKPSEWEEETELAAIFKQQLVRGRSLQVECFRGKENQMGLIEEIRIFHAFQSDEQKLKEAEKELVMSLKKQRDLERQEIAEEEASQASVVGAALEQLFDISSKELMHLQEERRIHAFTLLAERERRRREAEESGRRQVEDGRRREQDEIFGQVVQVNEENVDMYLEDIILEKSHQVADQQDREEIRRRAKELNDIADTLEESRDRLQKDEVVSELIYSFLIPEMERITVRQKVHQKQARHLHVAQSLVQEIATSSGTSRPGSSQLTSPGAETSPQDPGEEICQAEQHQSETE